MQSLVISALLTILAAPRVRGFEPNTGSQLLVQAGSCSAFEFTTQPQYKFTYTLKLLSVAAAGCDRGQIRMTKFYIREACLKQRDNELGLNSYNTFTCPAATDSASSTCDAAFNLADANSLLTAGNATDLQSFDSGNVCATYGDRGFVYVKNNCFSPITVGLELDTSDYQGKLCLQVAGKSISGVGVAIIVVSALLALIVLSFLCCCCCRCLC
ncbi:hypothetical protein WJX81_005511 [Elliptochloris bilobata]|uniref:Uncharacterized protein n=1 Tax=Elliptochloris bilobata TaxID=381761 RepID=A0AAW1SBB7_9CHLO